MGVAFSSKRSRQHELGAFHQLHGDQLLPAFVLFRAPEERGPTDNVRVSWWWFARLYVKTNLAHVTRRQFTSANQRFVPLSANFFADLPDFKRCQAMDAKDR